MTTTLEMAAPVASLAGQGETIPVGRGSMTFKSPLPGSSDAWMAAVLDLPAGQLGAPPHYHKETTESFYILSGEVTFRVGDEEIVATAGSYFFVPPGTVHAFANRSSAPAQILGQASTGRHKEFLTGLFEMSRTAKTWPPEDPSEVIAYSARYDSYWV